MNGVQAKKVLSYVMLPQVIPRAKSLFASGFGYMAFLMASIYGAVRLLPREHPYLNPANIGKFGIQHVIGEAANNLVLKKENIDQIAIFVALLFAVVILLLQLVMVVYVFIFKPAFAASIFLTPDPGVGGDATDMAFIVLDQVFGIPELFCTEGNICTAIQGTLPWPFHVAFHELLRFYSLGLLIVGVLIFLYYVLVVVGETATTGSPFGQRFQNVWVPIRLVVALGLLVPINYGLNSAQYIVLYAAKFGSGFATNGWLTFNEVMRSAAVFPGGTANNPTGERRTLLAKPQTPSVMPIVQAMTIVHACAYSYWKLDTNSNNAMMPPLNFYIKPYLVKQPQDWMTDPSERLEVTAGLSYVAALNFYDNSDIIIRFGRFDGANTEFNREKGKVFPYCGDIRIPINYLKTRGDGAAQGGPDAIQEFYWNLIKAMWFGGGLAEALPQRFMEVSLNTEPHTQCSIGCAYAELPACGGAGADCARGGKAGLPNAEARQAVINPYKVMLDTEVETAWNTYNTNATDIQMQQEVLDRGWAGAGIWYNTIAEINGAFVTSIYAMPYFETYPYVMDKVRKERLKSDSDFSPKTQFNPNLSNGKPVEIPTDARGLEIEAKLNAFYLWWNFDDPDMTKSDKTISGGAFQDAINAIFGIGGLFALRGENADIHPLAQLAAVGKSLVDSAILNIAGSTITAGLGGLISVVDKAFGNGASIISGFTMTIAFLGLTAGFILYYVLPFLPFLYFFFAFGTWVKSIFEAMVGAPLWALAHLRLDGEGLPGDSASSGYFLIFEIFVRPILTVFGLVGAVLILTAQVRILNVIWDIVTSNLTGFESYTPTGPGTQKMITYAGYEYKILPKNTIDQFFFTIVYALIVYMMATASFKLIDKIPDQILRFMGAGVSAFSDINPDPTEGLTRYAALGGITVGQNITGGVRELAGGVGGALGSSFKDMTESLRGVPPPTK